MELFWLKGFGSTSIADILSRSQVNSGSLYYFFPGKQDVLVAVLEAYRDGSGAMLLPPAWSGVDDPVERVFPLLASYRRALVDTDCTYGCPIGSLALELHEPDPPVRELLAANFTAWVAAVQRCIRGAEDRFPANTDFQALADQCGYYDQAHLSNEFRAFTGLAPGDFVRAQQPDSQSIVIR